MWVNRNKLNNSLVIFIHGLFGSPWTSWQGVPKRLQTEFSHDSLLRSYDMYLFQYETTWRRQPSLVPDLQASLHRFIEDVRPKYSTVVLVGHSQGGILAKLYILDRLRGGHGLDLPIDLVITLGTPHRGTPFAILAFPFPSLRQARQLMPWSRNIRTLRRDWCPPYISTTPTPPQNSLRYIRSITVVGAYDRFVRRTSARGFSVDTPDYYPAGHPELAKEQVATDAISRALRNHLSPDDILKAIAKIRADPTSYRRYVRHFAPSVAPAVQLARPGIQATSLEEKTAAILEDFLIDYPQRPLRGLSFGDSLVTYAERQLGPEL